jgi:hypothetical protein
VLKVPCTLSRALAILAVSACACKRSPAPPLPGPSNVGSASASSSPPAAASAASPAPDGCAVWTVNEHAAAASVAHFCEHFGPCPDSLQHGITRMRERFATVEARGNHRVLRGGMLGGRWYAFELDRLVGARIWDDLPFGPCRERAVTTYSAGLAELAAERGVSCGVVPGRDYTRGEPCRCNVQARQPTLVNGNRGPLLRSSLECLYEAGVATHLCQATLQEQRALMESLAKNAKGHAEIAAAMREARGSAKPSVAEKTSLAQSVFRSSERAECGGTLVSWPFQGVRASCRYDSEGQLTGLRWGKRYETEGFVTCPHAAGKP